MADVHRVRQYLDEALAVPTSGFHPWARQGDLPYFLLEAFELRQFEILGTAVLLAMDRNPGHPSLRNIRISVDKIRAVSGHPVIYVTDALASYERRRLIEQKVPFIVPGNQLYLPDLGIDLREYFRQRPGLVESPFSPSAQAMLISALLRPRWEPAWHPAETASRLGYTPMTLSRAVRELVASGLAQAHKTGRTQSLQMNYSPQETWERAGPLLRSPVRRTLWTYAQAREQRTMRLAGLSALAHHSMLIEPDVPVYAISRTIFPLLKPAAQELPEAMPGAQEWQLWNYSPALDPYIGTVDPLSLTLSLRDHADERIQSALTALRAQFPW
jgi:hypothetical protein